MSKNDQFAQIAEKGIQVNAKGLILPQNRKPFDRLLQMEAADGTNEVFRSDLDEKEEVNKQVDALRRHYAPFMENHAPQMPRKERINLRTFQWRVAAPEDHKNFISVLKGAGEWTMVTIPHYGGPVGMQETIYRTTFEVEKLPGDQEAVFLHFKGVDYIAKVILNGTFLGMHEGFFAPFEFDCTNCILEGTNTLVVCVENDYVHMGNNELHTEEKYRERRRPVSGDKIYAATGPGYDDPEVGWHHCPPGMGIYQDVYLETRPRMYMGDIWGRPILEESSVELHMEAFRIDPGERRVTFRISVYGHNFCETVAENLVYIPECGEYMEEAMERKVPLYLEKGINYYKTKIPMGDFRIWDQATPWLYQAQVEMIDEDGTVLDRGSAIFGMRSFTMDVESEKKGMMYLNGKKIRLRGANTMGYEQQSVMKQDWNELVEDILLVKACHINFLRITQRPVQDEIYQYCDMLGLLVQTDFPLFGALRRNKFAEAVKQVEEMERLVRGHACVIMDTYINEPFHTAMDMPHRCLMKDELQAFFEAADLMVHLVNPDRVIKHVDGDYDPPRTDLPDNHCYTFWYNGHGLSSGALYRGEWIEVLPGWYYGCGEFGAEGLDFESTMRKHYPKEWLPWNEEEDREWTPDQIVLSQSGSFHYSFFETPTGLKDWIKKSHEHQAEATKLMTEAFRRDENMVSFAIHLGIDAFPAGWMKSIVDYDRNCKPAYYAYRSALSPVMCSLRTDRQTFFAGETTYVEVWLCNDRPEKVTEVTVMYEAKMPDGNYLSGSVQSDIAECGVTYVGEILIPVSQVTGDIVLYSAVLDKEGTVLHRNSIRIKVFEEKKSVGLKVWTPDSEGNAAKILEDMQEKPVAKGCAECILLDDYKYYDDNREEIDAWVAQGHKLVFLELARGEYTVCGQKINIKRSNLGHLYFVHRNTGHPLVEGFGPKDFSRWYGRRKGRISTMLTSTIDCEAMSPVLTTGNRLENQDRIGAALAAGEMNYGDGKVTVCQVILTDHVQDNPVAFEFASRLLH